MHRKKLSARHVLLLTTALLILAGSPTGAVAAEFDARGWKWSAPLETEPDRSGFVRLNISPEVVDKSQRSLRDLRVVDENRELVPHIVHFEQPATELVWREVVLMNQVYREGEYARAVLNFGGRKIRNRVRVRLTGEDFRRYALLEGSDDGEQWGTVDAMWMFRIHDGTEVYETDTFKFSNNNLPYMRLSVFNMEDEAGRIGFDVVETAYNITVQLPTEAVTITVESVQPDEKDGNVTLFDIDLPYKNLPLKAIAFNAIDPYFYRRYELQGRDADTETIQRKTETGWDDEERKVPWRTVKRGIVYRMERDGELRESTTIDNISPSYRHFRLRIINGDDAPLEIRPASFSVTRGPFGTLVYEQQPGKSYVLLYGNLDADAAEYDLAKAFDNLGERDLPSVTLAVAQALPQEADPLAWAERYAWAIWVVLVVAVGLLLALIARNMGRLTPEE